MDNQNVTFCESCLDDVEYIIKENPTIEKIRGKKVKYIKKEAYCKKCGDLVYVGKINDENLKSLYSEIRKIENLISVESIEEIIRKYNIGKRPLSKLLGWGELTITRYLEGFLPNKEYSDRLKLILNNSNEMLKLLELNKDSISNITYNKSIEAIKKIKKKRVYIDKKYSKIIRVSKYMESKMYDITPLSLQKLLYYSQSFYKLFTGKDLFNNNCEISDVGPIYKEICEFYKDHKNEEIDLNNNIKLDNYIEEEVVNLVIKYFGCYSTDTLINMTKLEKPFIFSKNRLEDNQESSKVIEKDLINSYFEDIKDKYDIINFVDIKNYSSDLFLKIVN